MQRTVALVFALLGLAACDSPYVSYPQAKSLAESPGAATKFFSNTTVHSYSGPHSNQYEYLAADGSTALLYPGNRAPVRGFWQVRGVGEFDTQMCFLYGANTYNPVTREGGGAWECRGFIDYLYHAEEVYDGDVFGTRTIKFFAQPFPRWSSFVPISAAVAETGRQPPKGKNKAFSKAHK